MKSSSFKQSAIRSIMKKSLEIERIDVYSLKDIGSNLTREVCEFFSQAAAVCLDNQNHSQGIVFNVDGDLSSEYQLFWKPVTPQMRDSWDDMQDTTEDGSCCLAILIVHKLTEYKVIRRARKKTGFDYWLGNKESEYPFQEKARLEISGILNGNKNKIRKRIREKIEQTKQSDHLNLPAYIVVVEFGTPTSQVVKR